MPPLSKYEKVALIEELRRIYIHCVETGFVPSKVFIKLEQLLKAEYNSTGPSTELDCLDCLYYGTARADIESWLELVEARIEQHSPTGQGCYPYSSREVEFIEDMRSNFESERGNRPLSGKQLKWLKDLYDRS
jgi:hypothetical protein